MQANRRRTSRGIEVRHTKDCVTTRGGRRCNCVPSYRAEVFSAREGRKLRKTFAMLDQAEEWRESTKRAVRQGRVLAGKPIVFREAAAQFLDGARDGSIRNRSGDEYKPSVIREYERAFRLRLLPAIGAHKLVDVRRSDLQRLVGRWLKQGYDPSTIRNTINAARAVYRHALACELVMVNPTAGLNLPAVRGRRERIATPHEAARLLDALPAGDRALWATFLYAGLRRGEAQALRWSDVDLPGRLLNVCRSWDQLAGEIQPKSHAGRRVVPINTTLAKLLAEHKLRAGRSNGYVFPTAGGRPFDPSTILDRARRAWKAAGLDPLTPHEARHTYASLMIAAGVNAKTLSTYMGHAAIAITLDRYGHLFPGAEQEAAAMLDALLARAHGA